MGEENKQVVKVVTTINTGIKPIPVNSQDAINIARQNALNPQNNPNPQVINTNNVNQGGLVMTPINLGNMEENIPEEQIKEQQMPLMGNNPGMYTQEDVDALNGVNDLVKVVDVKYSKKTVLIMVGVIVVFVLIFLIFELPMLMEL